MTSSHDQLKRPEDVDFVLEFCGDPEESVARQYIEALEARAALAAEPDGPAVPESREPASVVDELSDEELANYLLSAGVDAVEGLLYGNVVAWEGRNEQVMAAIRAAIAADRARRAATAPDGERQAAPVPVAVSERPWEREKDWRDLDGECWWYPPEGTPHWQMANPAMVYGGWVLPAHAMPIPEYPQPTTTP